MGHSVWPGLLDVAIELLQHELIMRNVAPQ
jgi:hypothetical protein